MIPKIIHYCWLSEDTYPKIVRICIDSWKKALPDYEIKCWNIHNFDINSIRFVKEAYEKKQWAFAADYIRFYVLYKEGGIYLDSDVFIKKKLDIFLNNEAFSCIELNPHEYPYALRDKIIDNEGNVIKKDKIDIPGIKVQAAFIGSVKGNQYLKDCMSYYENQSFILPDKSFNNKIIAPDIMAYCARKYDFRYIDELQDLDVVKIYPSEVCAGYSSLETNNSYAIHYCNGSWRKKTIIREIKDYLKHNVYLYFKYK